MKIKTSEATPIQINWAVGVAEGMQWRNDDPEIGLYHREVDELDHLSGNRHVVIALDYEIMDDWGLTLYSPSTNWVEGGPIIEREEICVLAPVRGLWRSRKEGRTQYGPTPLIAAMRCYVASKLGDEVEVPEELQ